MKYLYFISYSFGNEFQFGFGNFYQISKSKIDSVDKIKELSNKFAEENKIKGLTILNIILLKKEKVKE